jgi:hypothetical protein
MLYARNARSREKPEISYGKINQMKALAVTQAYFDAWNRRNPDGIMEVFTEGGTYSDPTVGRGISREATANYAKGLGARIFSAAIG